MKKIGKFGEAKQFAKVLSLNLFGLLNLPKFSPAKVFRYMVQYIALWSVQYIYIALRLVHCRFIMH